MRRSAGRPLPGRYRTPQDATRNPKIAATVVSDALSTIVWRATWNRVDPSARRTATSRCLADARANRSIAQFVEASSSSIPIMTDTTTAGLVNRSRTVPGVANPLVSGTNSTRCERNLSRSLPPAPSENPLISGVNSPAAADGGHVRRQANNEGHRCPSLAVLGAVDRDRYVHPSADFDAENSRLVTPTTRCGRSSTRHGPPKNSSIAGESPCPVTIAENRNTCGRCASFVLRRSAARFVAIFPNPKSNHRSPVGR